MRRESIRKKRKNGNVGCVEEERRVRNIYGKNVQIGGIRNHGRKW